MKSFFVIILFSILTLNNTNAQNANYGIKDQDAPKWNIPYWIGEDGKETEVEIDQFEGKVIYMLCFQHWCPGCHSLGFPTLQYLVDKFKNEDDVAFVSVQTVFEGQRINNKKRLAKTQEKYGLNIPFGHDDGTNAERDYSNVMHNYKTGGTPWVIIIDKKGKVIFNDYDIDIQTAQRTIKKALKEE